MSFLYKKQSLILKQGKSEIPVHKIAKEQSTAFYLYDIYGLRQWYKFFVSASPQKLAIFYAVKANFNKNVLRALKKEGSGVDVVSLGEAHKALKLGFKPQKIIFSGVGKSTLELETAIDKQFFQINVESLPELKRLSNICKQKKKVGKIGLRINPNVDFSSHPYIKTGLSGHKFGFQEEELAELLQWINSQKWIELQGLSMHLGSQIFDLKPLFKAISHIKKIYNSLKSYPLKVLDIGGGLAVNYQKEGLEDEKMRIKQFGQGLKKLFKNFKGTLITEPGRILTAPFGILCAQVEYIKKSKQKQFVILNSGMNHFLRPALYSAQHKILPLKKSKKSPQNYDVVGPICETADTIAQNYPLSPIKSGDWLAIADTGAYGFVMANQYNLQPKAKEISFDYGKKL